MLKMLCLSDVINVFMSVFFVKNAKNDPRTLFKRPKFEKIKLVKCSLVAFSLDDIRIRLTFTDYLIMRSREVKITVFDKYAYLSIILGKGR